MKKTDPSVADPARAVAATMKRIYDLRLTTTSGGNVSIRDENGDLWITPRGVDKGELGPRDIVRVPAHGAPDGAHAPSSEWPFHAAIYKARPDLRAVVHAHPTALVAFSVCRRIPDTAVLAWARAICGEVGMSPYERSGSAALADRVAGVFADGFNCVILTNHGVTVAGADLDQAFRRFETLEHAARVITQAGTIGETRSLTDDQLRRFAALAAGASGRDSSPTDALAADIRRFAQRGCVQGLMTSALGTVSARLDAGSFLITPHDADRMDVQAADPVRVQIDGSLAGTPPSPFALLHAAIYRAHRDVNAVIDASPVHATAFCAAGEPLNTHAMVEGYLLVRDLTNLTFDAAHLDPDAAAAAISPKRPAALIAHHGPLVIGTTLLEAFDRLEVLEATAAALIASRGIGSAIPLDEQEIDALSGISFTPGDARSGD